jgi:DNA-binding transcriptional regulator YiaG
MNRIDYIRACIGDRSYPEFAQELGVTPHAIAQWFMNTSNRRQPSDLTLRTVQLLTFIRDSGLEPPPPLN